MTIPPPPARISSFVGASSRARGRLNARPDDGACAVRNDLRAGLGVVALEGMVLLLVTLAGVPADKTPVVRLALAHPPETAPETKFAGGPLRPALLLADLGPAVPAPAPWRQPAESDYALLPPAAGPARRDEMQAALDTGHESVTAGQAVALLARGGKSQPANKPAPPAPELALLAPELSTEPKQRPSAIDGAIAAADPAPLPPAPALDKQTTQAAIEIAMAPTLDTTPSGPTPAPASEPLLLTMRAAPMIDDAPAQALDRQIRQPAQAGLTMLAALDQGSAAPPNLTYAAYRPHLSAPDRPPEDDIRAGLQLVSLSASWEAPTRDELAQNAARKPAAIAQATPNADQLSRLFDRLDYSLDTAQGLPPLFIDRLPADMARMVEPEDRKDLFLRTLLPLIAQVNERTLKDREKLLALAPHIRAGERLKPADEAFVSNLADEYGTTAKELDELLRRVDAVPPSLALAQAAQETGWGTSNPAQTGNALFGEMAYVVVAEANHRHAVAKVRRFDDLASAVNAYIRNLNTHRAYGDFRAERARLRAAGKQPDGHALAPFIQRYSERGPVYTQMLRSLIQWNNLTAYDGLRLDLSEQSADASQRR